MFSNFAPNRPWAGWGRRRPQDPTGFMPVVNQFVNIATDWGRSEPQDPTGFTPVVN